MDEYIIRNELLKDAQSNVAEAHNERCAQLLEAILNAPTADVVPKSEYDAVVSAVDNSTKEFLKLHDNYQEAKREVDRLNAVMKEMDEQRAYTINMLGESLEKAKSEVAGEIFEEIEFDIHQLIFERDETRAIAIEGVIANLKKKYTGEE